MLSLIDFAGSQTYTQKYNEGVKNILLYLLQ